MAVNLIIDHARVRVPFHVKRSTFVLQKAGGVFKFVPLLNNSLKSIYNRCGLLYFAIVPVKLCQQDNPVKHPIRFNFFSAALKRIKISLKVKLPLYTHLSFKNTARSVQNCWIIWQDQNRCAIVTSSWLQSVRTRESHIIHKNKCVFVGTIRCNSRSCNDLNCVCMVVCLHF